MASAGMPTIILTTSRASRALLRLFHLYMNRSLVYDPTITRCRCGQTHKSLPLLSPFSHDLEHWKPCLRPRVVQAQAILDLRLLPRIASEAVGQQAVHSNLGDAVKVLHPPQRIPEPQASSKDCKRARRREEARIMGVHAAQEVP